MKILKKVQAFVDEQTPLHKADRVLLAVSGGPDSHVLLDILIKLGFENVSVAHVNYHRRELASDLDEDCAREFAEKLGIPFYKKDIRISETKGNFQDQARSLRYEWFAKLMKEKEMSYILTAHHLDDQIETMAMRFFSGTRGHGLTGIPVVSKNKVRPLLCLDKSEILEYAKKYDIPYRIDQSNSESHYLRNFFRNEVIPQIEKRIPHLKTRVKTTRNHLLREQKLLKNLCLKHIASNGYWQGNTLVIPTSSFTDTEILHAFLCFQFHLNEDEARQITRGKENAILNFPPFRIAFSKQNLWVDKTNEKIQFSKVISGDYPTTIHLPNGVLNGKRTSNFKISIDQFVEYIPSRLLGSPHRIDSWKDGDKIEIENGKHKKVSDLLNEHHLSPMEKEKVCCLWQGNTILWVIGIRLSTAAYALPTDKNYVRFEFQKEPQKKVTLSEIEAFFF